MPRGKTQPRVGCGWASIVVAGRGTLALHDVLSVIGSATVSGELTCLPSTAPITYKIPVTCLAPEDQTRLLRALVLCNRRATSEIASYLGFGGSVHVAEM